MTAVNGAEELAVEAGVTLVEAQGFKIQTADQYSAAGERLKAIKGLMAKVMETFAPHIKRAHDAHKALVAEKDAHLAPLLQAESILKRGVLTYQQEAERIRREQEARAQEEARKERERLERQAAAAEAKGRAEKAEALRTTAAAVVAPILPVVTPKISGVSVRTSFKAQVVDLPALVKGIAAGIVPINAICADMAFLNNQARAMKETLNYPGVKVVEEQAIASRSV